MLKIEKASMVHGYVSTFNNFPQTCNFATNPSVAARPWQENEVLCNQGK